MKVEELNKKMNAVTIIAFVLVCIVLNMENISRIFHFSIPKQLNDFVPYFPLLFVLVIFTQRKTNSRTVYNEVLWESIRKKTLFTNTKKLIIRYSIVTGVGILFIFLNMFETRSGFSTQNMTILISLIVAVAITFLYSHFKKGFQVGYCDKGILYGYSSKFILISWKNLTDFELKENESTVLVYCKQKLPIYKIVLQPEENFTALKEIVTEKLTYKNVTKLLTDD